MAAKEANENLVCAILAEQVAALRDRMDASANFDLLWRTTALLSWLSGLLSDFSNHSGHTNPVLDRERAEAIAASTCRSTYHYEFLYRHRRAIAEFCLGYPAELKPLLQRLCLCCWLMRLNEGRRICSHH